MIEDVKTYKQNLSELAMWAGWQNTVLDALPYYAKSPIFVNQDVTEKEVRRVVASLSILYDPEGKTRDLAHGARPFKTHIGVVTRMWVDACVEVDFLKRHVGDLDQLDVLDIGAGYGRLAVAAAPHVRFYTCVDPVEVSVNVCRDHTRLYRPSVRVLSVSELVDEIDALRPGLAINVHSWNECSRKQVLRWLDALDEMRVPLLFTVTHGDGTEVFNSYEAEWPDFRYLLLERWDVVAQESIGLGRSPHVLWRRK